MKRIIIIVPSRHWKTVSGRYSQIMSMAQHYYKCKVSIVFDSDEYDYLSDDALNYLYRKNKINIIHYEEFLNQIKVLQDENSN